MQQNFYNISVDGFNFVAITVEGIVLLYIVYI